MRMIKQRLRNKLAGLLSKVCLLLVLLFALSCEKQDAWGQQAQSKIHTLSNRAAVRYLMKIGSQGYQASSEDSTTNTVRFTSQGNTLERKGQNLSVKVTFIEDTKKYLILSCITDSDKKITVVVPKEYNDFTIKEGEQYQMVVALINPIITEHDFSICIGHDIISRWYGPDKMTFLTKYPTHYLYLGDIKHL